MGTIDSYYEANMDLIHISPQLNLYNYKWPILTNQGNLPPAKTVFDNDDRRGQNIDSYVCAGCITSGGTVRRSIIGPLCKINSYSLVEDSILFENVNIGRYARIRKTIIDRGMVIPDGTSIGYDHGSPVSERYTGHFAFEGRLSRLDVTLVRSSGEKASAEAQERAAMSRQ